MSERELTVQEAGRLGRAAVVAKYGVARMVEWSSRGGRIAALGYRALPGLRAARRRSGMSRAALAARASLTDRQYVSLLELGKRKARRSTVTRLAAALGVDEATLLLDTE